MRLETEVQEEKKRYFYAGTVLNFHGKELGSILWRHWLKLEVAVGFGWKVRAKPAQYSSKVLVYLNYVCLRIECNNDCCITCLCIHVITVTSEGP